MRALMKWLDVIGNALVVAIVCILLTWGIIEFVIWLDRQCAF